MEESALSRSEASWQSTTSVTSGPTARLSPSPPRASAAAPLTYLSECPSASTRGPTARASPMTAKASTARCRMAPSASLNALANSATTSVSPSLARASAAAHRTSTDPSVSACRSASIASRSPSSPRAWAAATRLPSSSPTSWATSSLREAAEPSCPPQAAPVVRATRTTSRSAVMRAAPKQWSGGPAANRGCSQSLPSVADATKTATLAGSAAQQRAGQSSRASQRSREPHGSTSLRRVINDNRISHPTTIGSPVWPPSLYVAVC